MLHSKLKEVDQVMLNPNVCRTIEKKKKCYLWGYSRLASRRLNKANWKENPV